MERKSEGQGQPRVAATVLRAYAGARSARAEVRFTPGPTVLARPGESLLRIAEANQVPLDSGCRMGLCGADAVRILAGQENLSPPSAAERATLQRLQLPPGYRTACTARVRGAVTVAPGVEEGISRRPAPARPADAGGATAGEVRRIVIVGEGVAGVSAAVELRDRQPDTAITIVGAEPHEFYNRMAIDRLLTGATTIDRLRLMPSDWADSRQIRCRRGVTARSIDRGRSEVCTDEGESLPYDRLLLATGAQCSVPPIEGFGIPGSFVMRRIEDAVQLREHIRDRRCRSAVVVGGGLLGLEAAAAIGQMDVRVSVLEVAAWPLPRQLDHPAGALLEQLMGDLGVKILPHTSPRRILGAERVDGVELPDGQHIRADLVLVAAGIRPNVALAGAAGLVVADGIVVDDRMATSDPRIFAAGDAAAHAGRVQGLWAVGMEQARVAAVNMLGGDCRYRATVPPTRLKVPGIDLLSVGEIVATGEEAREIRVDDGDERRYRKLVLRSGKACGAIVVGHHELHDLVVEAVVENRDVGDVLPALERGDWSVLAA